MSEKRTLSKRHVLRARTGWLSLSVVFAAASVSAQVCAQTQAEPAVPSVGAPAAAGASAAEPAPDVAAPAADAPSAAAPATQTAAAVAPAAAAATATEPAAPAPRYVDLARINRLEAALYEHSHAEKMSRTWGGIGSVLFGGAALVGGVFAAIDDDADWGDGYGRAGLSAGLLAAGTGAIAAAIFRWITETPAELRFARWQKQRGDNMLNSLDFGRYEGELAAEAALAGSVRGLGIATGFGLVATGGTLIGLSAGDAMQGEDARSAGYTLGAILAGVGAAQVVALVLTKGPAERAWESYTQGGDGELGRLRLPRREETMRYRLAL